MRRAVLFALAVTCCATARLVAQEAGPRVESMTFCTSVEERQPVGADTTFAAAADKVYCLTRIIGMEGEATVTHVWFHGDAEVARVELPVRSSAWTTWSSKQMLPAWSGAWRVEVLDSQGAVLRSQSFTMSAAP